jgi:3-phosphoglycerate kinase
MKFIQEKVLENSIKHVTNLKGKKVLLRIDVNTSLGENGTVDPGEDWRIIKSYQTIDYLVDQGACVILISHIGRDPLESLKPIYEYMAGHITLGFLPRYDTEIFENTIINMQHGSVVMVENLRHHQGEKNNDPAFLDDIITRCDIYVNDAFSVSHRTHASVHAITSKLPSYFGLQFCDEINYIHKALNNKKKNTVLVLGGAKFGTKLDLLQQLLPNINYALVGGALANVFLRERGINIGDSFADQVDISEMLENEKIVVPIDAVDQHGDVVPIHEVGDNGIILDIGPETEKLFEQIIDHADSIIWNGPMGKYEDGYVAGSIAIADSISHASAFSVTGGGDTATVISEQGLADSFDFISTGGGAMLDFMVKGSLPAIDELLRQSEIRNKN